MIGEFDRIT